MEFYYAKIVKLYSLFSEELSTREFFELGLGTSTTISKRETDYSFADIVFEEVNGRNYIYGRLNKFGTKEVEQMNVEEHQTEVLTIDNGVIGSSQFIIDLQESTVLYTESGEISRIGFINIFRELFNDGITAERGEIYINPIRETYSFYQQLEALKEVSVLRLTIVPTNPDPSDIIRDLDEKLKDQNVKKKTLKYRAKSGGLRLDDEIKSNSVYTDFGYGSGYAEGLDQAGKPVKIYSKRKDKQKKTPPVRMDDSGPYGLIDQIDALIHKKKSEE